MNPTHSEITFKLTPAYRGIMLLGAICFVLSGVTGIWRIALVRGFLLPSFPGWWPQHGHLMVGGFLGGLIMFERIIALRIRWLVWVPYAYVVSAVFLPTGHPVVRVIHFAALAGWIVHRYAAWRAFRKYEKPLVETTAYITLSSALSYPGGLAAAPVVTLAALSFPTATILVERLEMSLNFRKRGAQIAMWMLVLWLILWNLTLWFNLLSLFWMGIFTLLIACSTMRQDMALMASRNDRTFDPSRSGMPVHVFLQRALAAAYAWLILGALSLVGWTYLPGAVAKDIPFHLLGLGFIFTMILAHAPLILPAALSRLPPTHVRTLPFVLFQAMTALRILADLAIVKWIAPWMWTGWITGVLHMVSFVAHVALVARSSAIYGKS